MYPLKTKKSYDPNNLSSTANIFTTVYLWNYVNWDFREMVWSHPWVDIVPQSINDSVFACLGWTVTFAWTNASQGNYIVIKHVWVPDPDDSDLKATIYSCYLHLSELKAKTWDIVKEWDVIWKSWNTWNSTWEHLHFQIDRDTAPFHPYWPFSFAEAKDAWMGFFDAVNKWLNIEFWKMHTLNPLLYLDTLLYKWIETDTTTIASIWNQLKPKKKYFTDIAADNEQINFLAEAGITKWYDDGTFRPEGNISRIEILAMVFEFAKINNIGRWKCPFSDVADSDWYCKNVITAKEMWIVSGYPDGTFRPNNPVTRIEAIAIVLNTVLWKANIPHVSWSLFSDIESNSWYEKYVYSIVQDWLLEVDWALFRPNDFMKRKEVAEILFNLKK